MTEPCTPDALLALIPDLPGRTHWEGCSGRGHEWCAVARFAARWKAERWKAELSRCPHCGAGPGEGHGVTCPSLPPGVFGSLTPEITTMADAEPPWFTRRMDRIESILFKRITRPGK